MLFSNHFGNVEITLSSANLSQTLALIHKQGFVICDISWIDEYTVRFTARRADLQNIRVLFENSGETIVIRHINGPMLGLFRIVNRPVIMVLIPLLILMTLWLPSRILFISVEGNATVSVLRITEEINKAGIRFMSSRRTIRSESVKNALLENIPQLQWVGINTYGCSAIITVQERNQLPQQQEERFISSIVAVRDGVIRDVVVEQGTAQCHIGQVVKKGQLLVSGYTDCGIYLKGTQAKAEIYADTIQKISVQSPCEYNVRCNRIGFQKKYSVIIGKKRINLYKGSGISGTTCAKIYKEKYMTLPGGFVLPIGIGVEEFIEYQSESQIISFDPQVLSRIAADYLRSQIQSGKVFCSDVLYESNKTYCSLTETFYCYEMIGVTYIEECVPKYE